MEFKGVERRGREWRGSINIKALLKGQETEGGVSDARRKEREGGCKQADMKTSSEGVESELERSVGVSRMVRQQENILRGRRERCQLGGFIYQPLPPTGESVSFSTSFSAYLAVNSILLFFCPGGISGFLSTRG